MAIRYVDLVNGNDANNGTTFALRKKTINSITGLTGPGDEIRVMETPGPTSLGTCTWTAQSNTVTLPGTYNAHINQCEAGWTASTNVTATYVTTATYLRQGTNCTSLSIAAAFTTGKVAYAPCATIDLSSYQQISFQLGSTLAIAANTIYIDLCSDATGDVPVHSFALPLTANPIASCPVTYDNGANLSNNINSIAIRCTSDPGTVILYLDNIIACQASSSATSLTLNSIIGLNTVAEPEWYAIKNINGNSITLEGYTYGWGGTAGSLTTYKIEPIQFKTLGYSIQSNGNTVPTQWTNNNSGGNTGLLTISCGWNSSDMTTQSGYTALDANIGSHIFNSNYTKFDKFIAVRFHSITNTSTKAWIDFGTVHMVNGNVASGQAYSNVINFDKLYITNASTMNFGLLGQTFLIKGNTLSFKNMSSQNSGTSGPAIACSVVSIDSLYLSSLGRPLLSNITSGFIRNAYCYPCLNSSYSLLSFNNAQNLKFQNVSYTAPAGAINNYYTFGIYASNNTVSVQNLTYNVNPNGSGVTNPSNSSGVEIFVQNVNGTNAGRGVYDWGQLDTVTSPVHTAGGLAWRLKANSTVFYTALGSDTDWYKYQNVQIGEVAVTAGTLVTLSIWTQRAYTTAQAALFVKPNFGNITDYVVAKSSAAANTWEQLTISFTPSIDTVVDVFIGVQYDTTNGANNFYFDDFSATQA